MNTIDDNISFLNDTFGQSFDLRLVPSTLIGGGYLYRATVTNLPVPFLKLYTAKRSSYKAAFDAVTVEIKQAIDDIRARVAAETI